MNSIKTFESLREDILSKIADAADQVNYADGECIVRQGAKGDTFYIVAKGSWNCFLFVKIEHLSDNKILQDELK